MNYQLLETIEMDGKPHVLLHGRYVVSATYIKCVIEVFEEHGFESMVHGQTYIASQLLADCWGYLSNAEKRLAGSCLSHVAKQGHLPIRKMNAKGLCKYQLLPTVPVTKTKTPIHFTTHAIHPSTPLVIAVSPSTNCLPSTSSAPFMPPHPPATPPEAAPNRPA